MCKFSGTGTEKMTAEGQSVW